MASVSFEASGGADECAHARCWTPGRGSSFTPSACERASVRARHAKSICQNVWLYPFHNTRVPASWDSPYSFLPTSAHNLCIACAGVTRHEQIMFARHAG